jgi:gamma-glutamylcyclotransferase (GGCT)/AIG2-like uncharacterized protein YtfP
VKETSIPLFVYGTLKKGFGLHSALNGAPFIQDASLKGFQMFSLGGYPGIVRDEKAGTVKGEIYEVDPITLHRLDYIEGSYNREWHVTTEGKMVGVYVWAHSTKDLKKISNGIWGHFS